jgi:DNA-directed RNA polymerase specialized sigma subunit
LKEIAVVLGLTESRICQLHAQAILTIRVQLQMRDALRGNSRRLQP